MRYRAPARPGDTVRSQARWTRLNAATHADSPIVIEFICLNQRNETVLDGRCLLTPDARWISGVTDDPQQTL